MYSVGTIHFYFMYIGDYCPENAGSSLLAQENANSVVKYEFRNAPSKVAPSLGRKEANSS